MTGYNTYLSVLTLNINGFNDPIQRHRITNWANKQDPTIHCLQDTHLTEKSKHWLKFKGWNMVF
jgi:exonuclease III